MNYKRHLVSCKPTSGEYECATQAIYLGLKKLGLDVDYLSRHKDDYGDYGCIWIWNGRKTSSLAVSKKARPEGRIVFTAEIGFFQRGSHSHIDHQGILHWTSWAKTAWRTKASPRRFNKVCPSGIKPMASDPKGTILVIGQKDGDTQMQDSEIKRAVDLAKLIKRSAPKGRKVVFRPHPKASKKSTEAVRKILPFEPERGLWKSFAKAQFVVAINSNACVESLICGTPALMFGPATALYAGVARRATVRQIKRQLHAMACGWTPKQEDVNNYLYMLAEKQVSWAELASGAPLEKLIRNAYADHGITGGIK